ARRHDRGREHAWRRVDVHADRARSARRLPRDRYVDGAQFRPPAATRATAPPPLQHGGPHAVASRRPTHRRNAALALRGTSLARPSTAARDARRDTRRTRMRVLWRMAQVGVAVAALVAAPAARAQIKGSFDGALDDAQRGVPLTAAAALSQVGKVVSGTMVFAGDPAAYGGAFLVHGKATKKRVKLSGVYNSFTLKWTAKIAPGTLTGRAKLKAPGTKIAGILALTENVSTADGSACDGVYDGNTTLFHDQVLGDALTSCRACHVAGGQADAAR